MNIHIIVSLTRKFHTFSSRREEANKKFTKNVSIGINKSGAAWEVIIMTYLNNNNSRRNKRAHKLFLM